MRPVIVLGLAAWLTTAPLAGAALAGASPAGAAPAGSDARCASALLVQQTCAAVRIEGELLGCRPAHGSSDCAYAFHWRGNASSSPLAAGFVVREELDNRTAGCIAAPECAVSNGNSTVVHHVLLARGEVAVVRDRVTGDASVPIGVRILDVQVNATAELRITG